jgi:deoxyribose-phosphate aldolase
MLCTQRKGKTMSDHYTPQTLTYEQLARTIDHALLKPEMTGDEVTAGCQLAIAYHVASVCVRPCDVPLATRLLGGSDVKVGTVIGFPHGSMTSATKAFEARQAIAEGAQELDMVIAIGRLRSGDDRYVEEDIAGVVAAAGAGAIVKVILENAYLTDAEKIRGCQLAERAGARFVKTSTGFAPSGATLADIALMRKTVSPAIQVKASHGIRALDTLLKMLQAGATRIGTSSTQAILAEFQAIH